MVRSHLSELTEQVNPRRQKNKGYEGGGRGTLLLTENGNLLEIVVMVTQNFEVTYCH